MGARVCPGVQGACRSSGISLAAGLPSADSTGVTHVFVGVLQVGTTPASDGCWGKDGLRRWPFRPFGSLKASLPQQLSRFPCSRRVVTCQA